MLIGEVSERSGVSARMLRHYDRVGLVTPAGRTPGGYRDYSPDDVARLFHVEGLRSLGLSLNDIRDVLRDRDIPEPRALIDQLIERSRRRLAREHELLASLERVADAGPDDWTDVLATVRLMHDLRPSSTERYRAALDSGRHLSPEAIADAILAEDDPVVGGALMWSLAGTGAGIEKLSAGIGARDPAVRRRAVAALAKLTSPEADDLLRPAVHDTDPVVAARATLALGARGDLSVIPALTDLILDGTSDVDAADLLRDLSTSAGTTDEVAADLGRRLHNEGLAADARIRLAQALVDLPGPTADDLLRSLSDDSEPAIAALAALRRHLGHDGTPTDLRARTHRVAPTPMRPRMAT